MANTRFVCVRSSAFTATVIVAIITIIPVSYFQYSSFVSSILYYAVFVFFVHCLCSRFLCGGKIQTINKAVFITGCDTGFGNELAKRLDSKGFAVFAGCLSPETADLKRCCSDKLQVLYLDVTKDESVGKAVNFVKEKLGTTELWALVNNAGILKGFTIELTSIETFRENLEVNAIGPVRVTKAFLPLLRQSKGRVINVTSLSGRISFMCMCAYTMSKHAAVAFAECLSQEMKARGITVISIEPEAFRTPIFEEKRLISGFDEELEKIDKGVLNAYGEKQVKMMKKFSVPYANLLPVGLHQVIDDMESAVMEKYPDHVYKPRWNFVTRIVWFLLETMPYGVWEYILVKVVSVLQYRSEKM